MEYKGIEKRTCIRFEIPGAAANYKHNKIFRFKKTPGEEFCPVADVSRGGLRFLSKKLLKINDEVSLDISIPGEKIPLHFKGKVRWTSTGSGQKYKYQIGVQFYPYGEKKGQNYPGNLVKIIALEQKFAPPDKLETEQFDIEG